MRNTVALLGGLFLVTSSIAIGCGSSDSGTSDNPATGAGPATGGGQAGAGGSGSAGKGTGTGGASGKGGATGTGGSAGKGTAGTTGTPGAGGAAGNGTGGNPGAGGSTGGANPGAGGTNPGAGGSTGGSTGGSDTAGGAGGQPASACDPVAQSGCTAPARCTAQQDSTATMTSTVCQTATGTTLVGEGMECTRVALGVDNCADGTICTRRGALLPNDDSMLACRKFCNTDAECGDFQSCESFTNTGVPNFGVCIDRCAPFTACEAQSHNGTGGSGGAPGGNVTCSAFSSVSTPDGSDPTEFFFSCRQEGAALDGEACMTGDGGTACSADMLCLTDPADTTMGLCSTMCTLFSTDHVCPQGLVCGNTFVDGNINTCRSTGTVAVGAACTASSDCKDANTFCRADTMVCADMCNLFDAAHGCATGEVCGLPVGSQYGNIALCHTKGTAKDGEACTDDTSCAGDASFCSTSTMTCATLCDDKHACSDNTMECDCADAGGNTVLCSTQPGQVGVCNPGMGGTGGAGGSGAGGSAGGAAGAGGTG